MKNDIYYVKYFVIIISDRFQNYTIVQPFQYDCIQNEFSFHLLINISMCKSVSVVL